MEIEMNSFGLRVSRKRIKWQQMKRPVSSNDRFNAVVEAYIILCVVNNDKHIGNASFILYITTESNWLHRMDLKCFHVAFGCKKKWLLHCFELGFAMRLNSEWIDMVKIYKKWNSVSEHAFMAVVIIYEHFHSSHLVASQFNCNLSA